MEKIEVLWSGGFDSTFMLILLAKNFNGEIQPYYLNSNRHLKEFEINAIKKIYKMLKDKTDLKAKILPVKFVQEKFFIPSADVVQAFNRLLTYYPNFGKQQQILAEFSKKHKGIYCGQRTYSNVMGGSRLLMFKFGNIKIDSNKVGYFLESDCNPDVFLLYGNMKHPLITYTEKDMLSTIKSWKYEDVFQHINFCYFPIDGKPCGMCFPCSVKLKQNNTYLFDDNGFRRYKVYNQLKNENLLVGSIAIHEIFACCYSSVFKKHFIESFDKKSQFVIEKFIDSKICFYKEYFDSLLSSVDVKENVV